MNGGQILGLGSCLDASWDQLLSAGHEMNFDR